MLFGTEKDWSYPQERSFEVVLEYMGKDPFLPRFMIHLSYYDDNFIKTLVGGKGVGMDRLRSSHSTTQHLSDPTSAAS